MGDQELWASGKSKVYHPYEHIGSTAVVVLFLPAPGRQLRMICANCGDSRAVLCRGGRAVDLSKDHKPQNTGERARIEAAGGSVMMIDTWRVEGDLSLSRALGDFAYKGQAHLPPEAQKISGVPDIMEMVVQSGDEFVVMGSDGVFDVLTSEALVADLRDSRAKGLSWE